MPTAVIQQIWLDGYHHGYDAGETAQQAKDEPAASPPPKPAVNLARTPPPQALAAPAPATPPPVKIQPKPPTQQPPPASIYAPAGPATPLPASP